LGEGIGKRREGKKATADGFRTTKLGNDGWGSGGVGKKERIKRLKSPLAPLF